MSGLLLDTALAPRQREFAEVIRSSGEALLGIINDILDFSKIDAEKLHLDSKPVDLRAELRDVHALLGVQAAAKGLTLAQETADDVPEIVLADRGRLRQVLINLIGNAIKFTEHGGVAVKASLDGRADGRAIVRFTIEDTGIGISEASRSKLFQPFTQADSSMSRNYGGTGLGLAISKRLVELMGGEIGFESEVGRGTTFHFTAKLEETSIAPDNAPASQPDHDRNLVHAPAPSIAASNESDPRAPLPSAPLERAPSDPETRILLVEDNPTNQRVALCMLQRQGYCVDLASNGIEALEKLDGGAFDLVLMDCQMPEMDGFEATRKIRDRERAGEAHMPIVALTANVMAGDRERCRECGMDEYLGKPINAQQLYSMIDSTLTRLRAAHRSRVSC